MSVLGVYCCMGTALLILSNQTRSSNETIGTVETVSLVGLHL